MSILKSNKHVFWQALVLALIIFNFGIFLGYMLENSRTGKIAGLYSESEVDLLDVKILSDLYSLNDISCTNIIQENINFADRIYEQAKLLDRYESASRISDSIILQHRKYDLLRTLLWVNSMKLKENCNASFHDIVYFYKYNNPSVEEKAVQSVFSNYLGDLKNKYANNVILIPIAADNNVSAVNVLLKSYNVTTLPTILIDERFKITSINDFNKTETYLR